MASVLEQVKWGEKSIQFLHMIHKHIEKQKPAVLYLRHSKADYSQFESPKDGVLTSEGIQTSTFKWRQYAKRYAIINGFNN